MPHSIRQLLDQLTVARREQQMSQTELGSKVGIKQAYVSEIESGRRDTRLSIILNIARVLGFELMLVPRHLIPAVEQMIRSSKRTAPKIPTYEALLERLGEDDE